MGIAGRVAHAFLRSKLTPLVTIASLAVGALAVIATPREEEERGEGVRFGRVPLRLELAPLLLALVSVLLGVLSLPLFALLQIGRPEAAEEGLE